MTVGVTQARRIGATAGGLRVDRQHLGVARGLRGAGRDSRAGARARRTRWRSASWRRRWHTAPRPCSCAATSTPASAGGGGERSGSASTCSTRSIRSGSRGRRRSCSRCCSSSAGSRPTGSCCRPATWGTPPRSGRRCCEAHRWGLISRMPRLAAVQAAGAAPFARSFAEDFANRYAVRAETVATAIRIGDPASFDRAVHAIRETDGVVLAVTDEEILEAKAAVDGCGVGCEPASAASVAGVRDLVRRGLMAPDAARGGGAHGAHPQGSRAPAPVPPGDGAAAAGGEPADRDRRRRWRRDRAGAGGGVALPPAQINASRSARSCRSRHPTTNSAPSFPTASPTGAKRSPLQRGEGAGTCPIGFPSANGANTTR